VAVASVQFVICDRCRQKARVVSYNDEPERLAAVGLILGMTSPMEPYFVIECPNCAERIQVAGRKKPDDLSSST
jgi:hypothetical protein